MLPEKEVPLHDRTDVLVEQRCSRTQLAGPDHADARVRPALVRRGRQPAGHLHHQGADPAAGDHALPGRPGLAGAAHRGGLAALAGARVAGRRLGGSPATADGDDRGRPGRGGRPAQRSDRLVARAAEPGPVAGRLTGRRYQRGVLPDRLRQAAAARGVPRPTRAGQCPVVRYRVGSPDHRAGVGRAGRAVAGSRGRPAGRRRQLRESQRSACGGSGLPRRPTNADADGRRPADQPDRRGHPAGCPGRPPARAHPDRRGIELRADRLPDPAGAVPGPAAGAVRRRRSAWC